MLRTIRALLASAIVVVSLPLAATPADDDMVENPMYAHWAKFKPGATATVHEKTTYSGDKLPVPDEKTITYTLVSVSDDKIVVRSMEVEQEAFGTVESSPSRHTYPAKLKKSYLAKAVPELEAKKGEETIKWKDEELKCKTLTGSYKKGDETIEFKICVSDKVPGGIVKRTRTLKQKDDTVTTTVTLQSYSAKGKGKE
jgi:hypothetical protein